MQPIMIRLLVSRHSPTLHLQSLLVCDEKKNILLLLCFIFACRTAQPGFSLDSSLVCCVHSSRSSCHLQSLVSVIKGFHCVWETWRAGLPTEPSRRSPAPPSTCHVPFRCFHGNWSTGVQASCRLTPPSPPTRRQSCALRSTQTSLSLFHNRHNTMSKMLFRHVAWWVFLTYTMG